MARKKPDTNDPAYERHKEQMRLRSAERSARGRDIGDIPPVADPARRSACERSLRLFCETYLRQTFSLKWSKDHVRVIAKLEKATLEGGLFAMAMPRSFGKSSLCEADCIWATLYGHRRFVVLIGAEKDLAIKSLESIKTELETNELLAEDFPETCYPIARLEGIANRCKGQLYNGERTRISWKADEIVLSTITGSPASGCILKVAGITGSIRGMKHKLPDGKTVRPDLVVIDDPQTDESARSPSQCEARESILMGAILNLAGPKVNISGVMPCTVVRSGDLADRMLDTKKNPEWNGERTRMVYSFPSNTALWDQYAELWAEGHRNEDGGKAATEFYRQNRAAMDEGAEVAWPEKFRPGELSALQNAMNLRLRSEAAFAAECQNDPLPPAQAGLVQDLTAGQIAEKLNRLDRRAVPVHAAHVTAMIDVHQEVLYWLVAAWEENFTGHVIDYGTYPDQGRSYFTLRDCRKKMSGLHHGGGLEAVIYAGLEALTNELIGRAWRRDDGADMRIERCLIDANWGEMTETVKRFCRQSKFPAVVLPSHGKYIGARSRPMSEWHKQDGDRVGMHWKMPGAKGKAVRHVVFDANYWKSFIHNRLALPMATPGCLSLFGATPATHRLFADHLTAEHRVRVSVEGTSRQVDEWSLKPGGPDNHYLDCCVGAALAASIQGCKPHVGTGEPATNGKKRRKTLGEAMAAKGGPRRL